MEINRDNYYSKEADTDFFSASQIKAFMECEAMAMAEIKGEYERPTSDALLVGSYIDSYFEGTLGKFSEIHPEIFNSRTGELKANFKQAEKMIARAESDPFFMDFMQGDKQTIKIGAIDGFPFKAKFDVYVPHERIVDLKTVRDLEPMYREEEGRLHPIEYWRWDLQLAIYQEIERFNTGEKLPCYLAIITKEEPADIRIVQVDDALLEFRLEELKKKLPYYDAIKQGIVEPQRCDHCAYCRQSRILTEVETFNMEV